MGIFHFGTVRSANKNFQIACACRVEISKMLGSGVILTCLGSSEMVLAVLKESWG